MLLERYAREGLAAATAEERGAFAELLALSDPQLAEYLLGGSTPAEPRLARLTGRIRDLCRSGARAAVFCS